MKSAAEKTYPFAFRESDWEEVLAAPARPKGTFTIGEVTDLINESLVAQKLLLVRGHTTFAVVPRAKIDPKLVPAVEIKDLPTRGRTELVEAAIPLRDLDGKEVGDELKKLLTPHGEILLAKGKWLVVRDTAGNVARIVRTLAVGDCTLRDVP